MKKISTLVIMTFFCCLGALAQVELGDIKFSLGEGKKISPTTGKILVTFPDVQGVDPTTTSFEIAGKFTPGEELEFDGVTALFSEGYEISLSDYELEPKTDYALTITSVKVNSIELLNDTTFVLHFQTRSAERKMSWTFTMDEASSAQIVAEGTGNTEDTSKYSEVGKNRWYVPARNYEEIFLPDGTILPMAEDLLFKFGNKSCYVGDLAGSYKDRICFNGNNQYIVIPDCKVGDVISFTALRATANKPDKKKYASIMSQDGNAIAADGFVSEQETNPNGIADSITLGSSTAVYKFEAQVDGDLKFKFSNCHLFELVVAPAQPKVPRNYTVVAQYQEDGSDAIVLKELVAKTEATTGSTIKANYPYWLADAAGNAYTHGVKGSEFVESFDLKYGEVDTVFVINYAKTAYTGVAYLSEGEDIVGSILCTSPNAAIRSSMGKAAYVMEDTKLVTLQPGTYKIRAILFDAGKNPGYVCVFSKGATENDEISLTANSTNWTEAESDLLTITEATDIKLLLGGSETTGLDVVMIYASDDAPEDPQGITEVNAGAQKMAARKLMKEGKILIQTEAGTVNVAGQLVK